MRGRLRAGAPSLSDKGMRLALALLAGGLLWRVFMSMVFVPAWEAHANVASFPDAYPMLGRSLLEKGVLGFGPYGASPTTTRGPGFPIWLAIGIALGGDSPPWMGIWASLPNLLVGFVITLMVIRRYGNMAGIVAAGVAIFHPLPTIVGSRVLGDDFFGSIGFLAAVAWSRALTTDPRGRAYAWALAAALLLALQMLTRSNGLLTLIAAVIAAAFFRAGRRRAGLCACLIAVSLLPPLAWSVRSSRLEGRPVFVHSLGAYNFWLGEGFERFGYGFPPSPHWPQVIRFVFQKAELPESEAEGFYWPTLEPRRLAAMETRLEAAARERILGDPLGYLGRFSKGLIRFWVQASDRARTLEYAAVVIPVLLLAIAGVLGGGAGAGAGAGRAGTDPLLTALVASVVLHNVAFAGVIAMARKSVQIYPSLAYLTGVGVSRLAAAIRLFRNSSRPA